MAKRSMFIEKQDKNVSQVYFTLYKFNVNCISDCLSSSGGGGEGGGISFLEPRITSKVRRKIQQRYIFGKDIFMTSSFWKISFVSSRQIQKKGEGFAREKSWESHGQI